MLNFILGRSKSGKSHHIMDSIKQICSNSDKRIFLIVPDQYTFEMEQKYLEYVGAKRLKNVNIMGFSRIAHHIFKMYGGVCSDYANESVKLITMYSALREVEHELTVYKKSAANVHFTSNMLSLITNFKHANVSSEEFLASINKFEGGLLKEKSRDISLIYSVYDGALSQNYKDELDDVVKACQLIHEHNFFADSLIFIDEFKDFTQRELELIRLMLLQASEVYLSLCMPKNGERHSDLFDSSQKTYNEISLIARQNNVKISLPISLEGSHGYQSEMLSHLEANIFSPQAKTCDVNDGAMNLVSCENEYSEVEYVMSQISKSVREDKLSYSDIVIVTRELQTYSDIIENVSKKYNIPIYLDSLKSIEHSPLIKFVSQILSACSTSLASEDIISLLKFDLCGHAYEDIAKLENYCYVWDIKIAEWENDFNYSSFFTAQINDDEAEEKNIDALKNLNYIKDSIYPQLKYFANACKNVNVNAISTALIDLLCELKIAEHIQTKLQSFENSDLPPSEILSLCSEYKAVWEILGNIINIINSTAPDRPISLKQYSELFHLLCKNFDMGSIPKSLDNVLVGDIKRIRTNAPKILFIIGANEGVFPYVPSNLGLYTNSELQTLSEMGIKLSVDIRDMIKEEQFISYKTMALPSQKLYICGRKSDIKGKVHAISSIFEQICAMFGEEIHIDAQNLPYEFFCATKETAFGVLTSHYGENTEFNATLHEYFASDDVYKSRLDKLKTLHEKKPFKLNDKDTIKKLYGENVFMSPTRVEQYHKCKFMYFCEQGLRLKKRERIRLNALNKGLIIHEVLAKIFLGITDFSSFDEDKVRAKIKEYVDEFIVINLGGFEHKSKRFFYLYTKICKNIFDIVSRLFSELVQSEFTPSEFEYKISPENKNTLKLKADDININIIGTVDRVDVFTEKTGKRYIRVVDYKSGSKKFELSNIINGINLQMFIYLMCLNQGKQKYSDADSAGVLYMPARELSPSLERDDSEAQAQSLLNKHYKMSGAVLENRDVLMAMDKEISGDFLPISLKANGRKNGEISDDIFVDGVINEQKFTKSSIESLLTSEQIGKLFDSIKLKLYDMAHEIYIGNIEAKPLIGADIKPCDFCNFNLICAHEDGDAKNEYKKLSKKEIFEYLDSQKEDK